MQEPICPKRVDLRDIFSTEAHDFTPWLAREENLFVLADTLKMDLDFEAQGLDAWSPLPVGRAS